MTISRKPDCRGEAAIDSAVVAYEFKEMTQRQRPYQGNGHGNFFAGGGSFPSVHSAIASSSQRLGARVPGLVQPDGSEWSGFAVTVTRVAAKQHFPSHALTGSALGWYFGRQVYRAHHDPELGGTGGVAPSRKKTKRRSATQTIWLLHTCPWIVGSIPPWSVLSVWATFLRTCWECGRGPEWRAPIYSKMPEKNFPTMGLRRAERDGRMPP